MFLYRFSIFLMIAIFLALNSNSQAMDTTDFLEPKDISRLPKDHIFSEQQLQRLQSLRQMSLEDRMQTLTNSQNWYERNQARAVVALLNRIKGEQDEDSRLILAAHQEEYYPATFELAQMAFQSGNREKALSYFRDTCAYFLKQKDEVPESTRKEHAASLLNFANKSDALGILNEFNSKEPLLIYKQRTPREVQYDKVEEFDDIDFGEESKGGEFREDVLDLKKLDRFATLPSIDEDDDFMKAFDEDSGSEI